MKKKQTFDAKAKKKKNYVLFNYYSFPLCIIIIEQEA